jgi:ferredoxin
MQKVNALELVERAVSLLSDKTVSSVLGWKKGEFDYDITPALFSDEKSLREEFVFSDFCGINLSKYLVAKTKTTEGKILVFLKPCDTYSFNQLLTEHRIDREKVYVIGVPCEGMVDIEKVKKSLDGISSITSTLDGLKVETIYGETKVVKNEEVLLEKCVNCKSKKHVAYDELIGEDGEVIDSNRFDEVARLEALTPDERFEFWQNELSKCIRCNACRDACPACTCEKCVFDNPKSGLENKSPANEFEEKLFHIIRAFHVAGRCTDCGECSRACPQNIPLHLLNRKFIKEINEKYGEYQAGSEVGQRGPLVSYTVNDVEPSDVFNKGGKDA